MADLSRVPKVQKALEFVDDSIGKAVTALKAQNLYNSTMIIVTAKHAQSPLDPIRRRIVDLVQTLAAEEADA